MEGLGEWEAAMDALAAGIDAATYEQANLVASYLQGVLHPQHPITGAMSRSITGEIAQRSGNVYGRFGPTDPATRIIELGHRKTPHRPSYREAKPWFRPGWETLSEAVMRGFIARWSAVIEGV